MGNTYKDNKYVDRRVKKKPTFIKKVEKPKDIEKIEKLDKSKKKKFKKFFEEDDDINLFI